MAEHEHHAPLVAGSTDVGGLAAALEPALIETCGGRLSGITWFKSPWQAGGASTGYATYQTDAGGRADVVVKLPVGPAEYTWTTELCGHADDPSRSDHELADRPRPTLRVYACGTELAGYDLAWLIVERVPGQTLSHELTAATGEAGPRCIQGLLHTAAHWYKLAGQVRPVDKAPKTEDWAALLGRAREVCRLTMSGGRLAEAQRWNTVIKETQKILPRLVERWNGRPVNTWCHGDLHPGNAMRRSSAGTVDADGRTPAGGCPCVLLDLALVHPGHWVEDAVYLERLYWGRPELLHGVKVVTTLSKCRKELGLSPEPGEDHTALANVRRVLMAASVPVFLEREGHPKYVHTALETLERLLPLVSK